MEKIGELLKSSCQFDGMEDSHIATIASIFERTEVKRGEILVEEKKPQDRAFLIEEGTISRQKLNAADETYIEIDTLGPSRCSGALHLLRKDPAYARLSVDSETAVVWEATSERFTELMANHPDILLSWCGILAKTIRAQSKILRVMDRSKDAVGLNQGKPSVVFFDATAWTMETFDKEPYTKKAHFVFHEQRLGMDTVGLANGFKVVCCFVNDCLDSDVITALSELGVKLILMRCAGFDRVDIVKARLFNITVARVPAYSPHAVAEHALSLLMTVNRKIHKAYQKTREGNFELKGLVGFDLYGKTVGIIGTGKIGACLVEIMLGMGCNVLCYDVVENPELKGRDRVTYCSLDELLSKSTAISLHAPLLDSTKHMINDDSIKKMKTGAVIINTSRGGLIDSQALIRGLRSGKLAGAGIDVYENESKYFFRDNSNHPITDPVLTELLGMSNVVVTGHQAFLTQEALTAIANTTMDNLDAWLNGKTTTSHPNSIYK